MEPSGELLLKLTTVLLLEFETSTRTISSNPSHFRCDDRGFESLYVFGLGTLKVLEKCLNFTRKYLRVRSPVVPMCFFSGPFDILSLSLQKQSLAQICRGEKSF